MASKTIIGMAALGLAGNAGADIIEFTFGGLVESVEGIPQGGVEVGDAFEFVYRFDSNAPDSDGAPNFGNYAGAAEQPSVVIDGWVAPGLSAGDINVLDNGFAGDSYFTIVQTPLITATASFTDFDGIAVDGDALLTDLTLSDWEIAFFEIEVQVGPTFWSAEGTITEFSSRIVPGPGVVVIGALGLVPCFARRRR